MKITDLRLRYLQFSAELRLALRDLPQSLLVHGRNAHRARRRPPLLSLPVVCRTDQLDVLLLNGMDAPFLNRHRGAKVEVQSNHF